MNRRLVCILAFVLLSGCATPAAVPQDSFHRMDDPVNVNLAGAKLDGILIVPRLLADGLISERPVVYVQANSSRVLRQYNYHFWSESPTRMIQDRAVEYLRRAQIAPMVVTPEFRAAGDYELTGRIRRLEQIRGSSPRVAVSLEFGLYRVRDNRLLHLRTYERVVELEDDRVGTATSAIGAAVLSILSRLAEDLSAID